MEAKDRNKLRREIEAVLVDAVSMKIFKDEAIDRFVDLIEKLQSDTSEKVEGPKVFWVDKKFTVGEVYSFYDDYRETKYVFKVIHTDKKNVFFESIVGDLENCDEQPEGVCFQINSEVYQKAVKVEPNGMDAEEYFQANHRGFARTFENNYTPKRLEQLYSAIETYHQAKQKEPEFINESIRPIGNQPKCETCKKEFEPIDKLNYHCNDCQPVKQTDWEELREKFVNTFVDSFIRQPLNGEPRIEVDKIFTWFKHEIGATKQKTVTDEEIDKMYPEKNGSGQLLDYNLARREAAKRMRDILTK